MPAGQNTPAQQKLPSATDSGRPRQSILLLRKRTQCQCVGGHWLERVQLHSHPQPAAPSVVQFSGVALGMAPVQVHGISQLCQAC